MRTTKKKGADVNLRDYTLLVDIDNTIEDLLTPWVNYLNEKHGCNVNVNDISDWHLDSFFPTLTREQIMEPLYDRELWNTVKPIDGADTYIPKLMSEGVQIYFVTCSELKSIYTKLFEILVPKYFPFINEDNLIVAKKKQMVIGDWLVDDNPHHMDGGVYRGLLFTHAYNKNVEISKTTRRVHDWKSVYHIVHMDILKKRI